MFKIIDIYEQVVRTVYGVTKNRAGQYSGRTQFLIFADNRWKWVDADNYIPFYGHDIEKGADLMVPEEKVDVLYLCNGKACKSEHMLFGCYINGGECKHTIRPEHAKNFAKGRKFDTDFYMEQEAEDEHI